MYGKSRICRSPLRARRMARRSLFKLLTNKRKQDWSAEKSPLFDRVRLWDCFDGKNNENEADLRWFRGLLGDHMGKCRGTRPHGFGKLGATWPCGRFGDFCWKPHERVSWAYGRVD
ncbi:hypothetical protein PVK06_034903 [Gossypium arboreum]|uniref:Uncharacterized protein n=1 Tax=Gossypium arboreum TaxID=29729 RepID=A0ABR0NGL0_GOSAR|nr:hypothetical protein PVK06_034903 [Gossypium arboreum]